MVSVRPQSNRLARAVALGLLAILGACGDDDAPHAEDPAARREAGREEMRRLGYMKEEEPRTAAESRRELLKHLEAVGYTGGHTSRLNQLGYSGGSADTSHKRAARVPRTSGTFVDRMSSLGYAMGPHGHHVAEAESYAPIDESGYRDATREPLSTFALDVDTASYTNVRRFLREGRLPPRDAVRVEELVNAFDYTDDVPGSEHPFAVTTEVAPAPWNAEHLLLRVGLNAEAIPTDELPPANLVLLVDVSGSMSSPDKLPLLKRSLHMLVDELDADDRLALVSYAGAAGLVLPSTSCAEKPALHDAIERLSAGGSTAGGAGLQLAYDQVAEHFREDGINRVLLCTDGDFNVGPSSDADMVRLIESRRDEGAFLTVLGFGKGNLKDSKMEQLADHGNGQYAYVDDFLEARRVLVEQLGGTLLTLAKDVKLQVEFNPARVSSYRLIGYENRLLAAEDFNDDTKDAGELGAGHSVVALYELVPVGADSDVSTGGAIDPLRYQVPEPLPEPPTVVSSDELAFVKLRYKRPDGERSQLLTQAVTVTSDAPGDDLRFAAAVAAFGMLLRDSPHCRDFDYDDVLQLARGSRGDDPHGRRGEFLGLVEVARSL